MTESSIRDNFDIVYMVRYRPWDFTHNLTLQFVADRGDVGRRTPDDDRAQHAQGYRVAADARTETIDSGRCIRVSVPCLADDAKLTNPRRAALCHKQRRRS